MKDTWRQLFRRLATGCVVCGSMAWASAVSYAVQLAYDSAADAVYNDGWQSGDNGGTGYSAATRFTAWNFDSRFGSGVNYTLGGVGLDDGLKNGGTTSNPHNNIGSVDPFNPSARTWKISTTPTDTGAPHIGRGFPALQPNQTLTVVVDNPTTSQFFKGYHIMLNGNSGGVNGNRCNPTGNPCTPGASPVNKFAWWRFEYQDYGRWKMGDATGDFPTVSPEMYDVDTAAAGMQFDFALTGADAYTVTVTTLGTPSKVYTHSGPLRNPGATLDWIEFVFYSPNTDTTPSLAEPQTDFYIRSMKITGPAPPGLPGDFDNNGKVDAGDYVTWRKNNGTSNALANDGGLGTPIGPNHYNLWRQNFGNPPGSGSSLSGSAVPEPGTFVLIITAGVAAIAGGARRRF